MSKTETGSQRRGEKKLIQNDPSDSKRDLLGSNTCCGKEIMKFSYSFFITVFYFH